jgi:hypothetical protein
MDVDLAEVNSGRLNEAERKRLQAEGRCFFCKAQGHMSRQCPKKQARTGNPPNLTRPRTITARAVESEFESDTINAATTATSSLDRKAVLKGIQVMSMEERTQLLDELIMSDQPSSSF